MTASLRPWRHSGVAASARLALATAVLLTLAGCSAAQPGAPVTVPAPSPTPVSSETSSPSPVQASRWGLSFAYPASWTFSGSTLDQHYIILLGYLGSGSGDMPCAAITPPPGQSVSYGFDCHEILTLPPGSVVLRFERRVGLGAAGVDSSHLPSGDALTSVGGSPAYFTTQGATWIPESDATWAWVFPVEAHTPRTGVYAMTVAIRGPDLAALEAQVQAVVASIRFDPTAP